MIKEKIKIKRIAVMLAGNFLIGIGIAFFKQALLGNDPSTALSLAFANKIHISLGIGMMCLNAVYFVAEIILARNLIGPGTFVNWFAVGIVCDWFSGILTVSANTLLQKLLLMFVGVLILSFGCALYQAGHCGIAPYDSLAIIIQRKTHWKYFWSRITTDSVCTVLALLLGGLINVGTLVCALGLGPFISFFTERMIKPVLGKM